MEIGGARRSPRAAVLTQAKAAPVIARVAYGWWDRSGDAAGVTGDPRVQGLRSGVAFSRPRPQPAPLALPSGPPAASRQTSAAAAAAAGTCRPWGGEGARGCVASPAAAPVHRQRCAGAGGDAVCLRRRGGEELQDPRAAPGVPAPPSPGRAGGRRGLRDAGEE